MNYIEDLKKILDKCNLSNEERVCFEDFMDGKVFKNKEAYPDCAESLRVASNKDPILNEACKKIKLANHWGEIVALNIKYYHECL